VPYRFSIYKVLTAISDLVNNNAQHTSFPSMCCSVTSQPEYFGSIARKRNCCRNKSSQNVNGNVSASVSRSHGFCRRLAPDHRKTTPRTNTATALRSRRKFLHIRVPNTGVRPVSFSPELYLTVSVTTRSFGTIEF
jgi:hypothetical protein